MSSIYYTYLTVAVWSVTRRLCHVRERCCQLSLSCSLLCSSTFLFSLDSDWFFALLTLSVIINSPMSIRSKIGTSCPGCAVHLCLGRWRWPSSQQSSPLARARWGRWGWPPTACSLGLADRHSADSIAASPGESASENCSTTSYAISSCDEMLKLAFVCTVANSRPPYATQRSLIVPLVSNSAAC